MHLLKRVQYVLEAPAEPSRWWPAGLVVLFLPLAMWMVATGAGPLTPAVAVAQDEAEETEEREEREVIERRERERGEVRERDTARRPEEDEERYFFFQRDERLRNGGREEREKAEGAEQRPRRERERDEDRPRERALYYYRELQRDDAAEGREVEREREDSGPRRDPFPPTRTPGRWLRDRDDADRPPPFRGDRERGIPSAEMVEVLRQLREEIAALRREVQELREVTRRQAEQREEAFQSWRGRSDDYPRSAEAQEQFRQMESRWRRMIEDRQRDAMRSRREAAESQERVSPEETQRRRRGQDPQPPAENVPEESLRDRQPGEAGVQ